MTTDAATCVGRIAAGRWTPDDLLQALRTRDEAVLQELWTAADRTRREHVGEEVHLRALIEFSSFCSRSCQYCGLRGPNSGLPRYRMSAEEIVATAQMAEALGYRTVVLQSGEDPAYDADLLAGIIARVKASCDVAVTLCVGERPADEYKAWREAGADRYLLRIETSDPTLYEQLHPGMSFDRRVACLHTLRELGYEVGSGVLIGLPGQTVETLVGDLLFLRDLGADMVGMGPLIPHQQTPLAGCAPGSVDTTLRMTALCRLLLPEAHIVATTALGTLDPMGRERGLAAGGNVVMPNVTPTEYRALYEIYPSKICIDETAERCRGCVEGRIASIGRSVARDRGTATRLVSGA